MSRIHPTRILACVALVVAPLVLSACRDHGPTGLSTGRVTLDRLWPYRDGLGWTYATVHRDLAGGDGPFYPSAAEVPSAPDMREIVARLLDAHPVTPVSTDTSTYVLRFAGPVTTRSGVTRPWLTETWIRPDPPPPGSVLLARLRVARPDLWPALRARLASLAAPADTLDMWAALFLHGYAWEKNTRWIGTYGDLDTLPAWKYLTDRLSPGNEFTHQLVPLLASDVFLHGRIMDRATVTTPAGTWTNAVRCAYLVDYGIAAETDPGGAVIGYRRTYDYGMVTYVTDVGPVACDERRMLRVGGDESGVADVTLRLTETGWSAPAPALAHRSR